MADPKIKYDIEANVKGDAEVGQLAGKLEALAKTLDGDLKTNANAAAAALRQLGDKQTAITRFVELKQGAQDAAAKLNDAQSAAQKMGQTLAATETPTRSQTGQMQKLGDAVRAAKAEVLAQNLAVQNARGALQQYGLSTQNLSQTQVGLAQSMGNAVKAANAQKASIDEMLESDRLLAIEARTLAVEMEKGRIALLAENAAQLDVAAQTRKTSAAKAAAAAAAREAEAAWQREAFSLVEAAEAAQKLKRETEALENAQRTLAANAAFEKQYQEARKLEQSAKYVKELGQALDKLEEDQQQAANAAKEAADKISSAFKTVGVRSAEELRAEIVQVRTAMQTVQASSVQTGAAVAGAFAAGQARIKELERDLREVSGTLTMADKAAGLFKNSMGQIAAGNIVADGVGYLVNKVKELGAAFLGAIVDGDQMRRGLNAIYKDAGTTAAQIEFLRRSSSESGVAFGMLSGEFVKFSASMKLANVPLEQSNNLFRAVTAASASLGLGSEATAGALNALGQMASKGTVSLEELRQQLGDRLPGAMGLTAKGLGITEAQLTKLVESGGLATRDFIVPFTRALEGLKGEIDGLVPGFDRFKGMLSEMSQGVGDAGGVTLLTGALKLLGGVAGTVALGLSQMMEGLFLVGAATVAFYQQLKGDAGAWDFFNQQVAASSSRLDKQKESLLNFIAPSEAAAASTKGHAAALTQNTAEVVKSINANASLSAEQKLASLSTALAGDATLDASAKMVQYNVAAAELIKKQEGQTEAYAKSAKAAKEQGDTLVALATLTGDATAIQNASTQAAELHSAALDKVAASQASETVMLVAQKAELLASAATRKLSAEDIKTEVEALDKKITTSQAETEQVRQSALAQQAELFERKLAVEALKNHSAEIDKLKAAMAAAASTLQEYERLALNGKKTDDDVAAARRELTRATVLYKDSLTDAIRNLDTETRSKSASLQLTISQSSTAQKHAEVMAAQARSIGDVTTATFYDIQAKEASIKTIRLQIQLASLEAEAARETIKLKLAELTGTDDLTASKRRILEVELEIIKIKLAGNDAAKETIKGIENEVTALRNGASAREGNTSSVSGNTSARKDNSAAMQAQADAMDLMATKYKLSSQYTENEIAALDRLTAATERATAAENKRLNRDKEGFSLDTGGKRVNMDVQNQRSVYENAKSQGLDEAQSLQISRQFIDSLGRQIGGAQANSAKGENWGTELQKAIDKQVLRNAGSKATSTSATDTGALISDYQKQLNSATARGDTGDISDLKAEIASLKAGKGGTPIGTPSTTVNINLNGTTQRVNTDADGARVLQEVLSQLGNAKSTSSR